MRPIIDRSHAAALGRVESSGPNPTDRGRPGVRHRVVTDGNDITLAATFMPANIADVNESLPLANGIGLEGEERKRPRRRSEGAQGPDASFGASSSALASARAIVDTVEVISLQKRTGCCGKRSGHEWEGTVQMSGGG
jgi:hypothetical protein